MLPLLSRSVHKFRAGVAIRKDTWRDSQQRAMIHFNPNVTVSIRSETFSNDLAFCTYPARRAMTAQEPMMTK
jgi:hypothetical protein